MSIPLLEIADVEKAFFGVKVLRGVSLQVPAGETVGLVGENGAGKSTLMNILGGNLAPDAGTLRLDGADYKPQSPDDAARRGIAFIHQELNLFPNLTIAENIFLTRFPRREGWPFIDRAESNRKATALLQEIGLDIPPDELVQNLSAGERQLIEIAKALSIDARLIIFDEPTTSLSDRETARLFALIARLRARGLAMIYISHTLPDIFRLCETVVILRDGEVVGSGPVNTFTTERLVTLMVGRIVSQLYPSPKPRMSVADPQGTDAEHPPLFEVRGLSEPGMVENISFKLHRGEVLGLSGLMGAGRSELARILFGLAPYQQGEIRLDGEILLHRSPKKLIERGIGFLTENRRTEGLCLDASVAANLVLASLPEHTRPPLGRLSAASLHAAVQRVRALVNLDPKTRDTQSVRTLSGGNQQKVVLGKWLLRTPRVLILDEPTRGIDVGARFEIYQLIQDLANNGAGVLVISSEMDELMGLCHRILVMRGGRLVDELSRDVFDRERILRAALDSTGERIT